MRSLHFKFCGLLLSVCGRIFSPCTVDANETNQLPAPLKQTVHFDRDVRPILAKHCFECHGPELQEGELRLDSRATLLRGGDSGEPAAVSGKSAESHLIKLVAGLDSDRVMPPEGERLTPKQIAMLRAWIDQGVKWSDKPTAVESEQPLTLSTDFWSFQPLAERGPPQVSHPWVRNPIDTFILKRLNEAKLSPSPRADRTALIRRLSLDMLGLPPTPDEIHDFQIDTQPGAYERLVDRLLASPHYGERWARHWLDVVRFAESSGFETNVERPNAWHYRDYVIAALNADKPYNKFVFEQLAGDSVGADAATGFLVGGSYDRVKSPDIALTLMQRQDELSDMINTTGTAFLGLTLGCAKCHNHKFDPVPQKDYYAVQAIFAGVKHGERPLRTAEGAQRMQEADSVGERITEIEAELARLKIREAVNFRKNIEQFGPVQAKFIRLTITATNNDTEPCIDELEVFSAAGSGQSGQNLALAEKEAVATASGSLSGVSIHQLKHVNDGKYGNSHSWISNERGRGVVEIELGKSALIDRIVWGRDREGKYNDRLAVTYSIDVAAEKDQWRQVATSGTRVPFGFGTSRQIVTGFSELSPETIKQVNKLLTQRTASKTRHKELTEGAPQVYAGLFEQPQPTHRLYRGDPLAPREVVAPNALSVIGGLDLPLDMPEQQRRVALADWITDPKNPLTARVLVNRLWHFHFGTGIVDTPSDLGKNGGRPTHPALLDWLARELIRGHWSLKQIHRLILTSATYQQASVPDQTKLAIDAGSRLLWRFPPRRLEAEAIRDSILSAAGTIDERMGGPGFSMFEPNTNYVRVYTPKVEFVRPEWRRMIYMTKIRMEHDAIFGAFDCPDAGQVTPKRIRSTTAIQALNLYNSKFIAQQSSLFSERLIKEAGEKREAQIRHAFSLVYGRDPAEAEQRGAQALIESHGLPALCRALFNSNELLFLP